MKHNVDIMKLFWLHWTKFIAVPEVLWIVMLTTSAATVQTATALAKAPRHRSANSGDIDRREISSEVSPIGDQYELPTHHHHVNERVLDLEAYQVEKNVSLDSSEVTQIRKEQSNTTSQPAGTNVDSGDKRVSSTSKEDKIDSDNTNNPISSDRLAENNRSITFGPILNFDSNSNIIRESVHPVLEVSNHESKTIREDVEKELDLLSKTRDKQNGGGDVYKERAPVTDNHRKEISETLVHNDEGKPETIDYVKCINSVGEVSYDDGNTAWKKCLDASNNRTVGVYNPDGRESTVSSMKPPLTSSVQEGEPRSSPEASRNISRGSFANNQNTNAPLLVKTKSKTDQEVKVYSKDILSQSTTKGSDDTKKKTKIKSKTAFHQLLEDTADNLSYISGNDSLLMSDQPDEPPAPNDDKNKASLSSPSTEVLDDSSEFLHHENESAVAVNASVIETSENTSFASANGRTMKAMSNKDADEEQSYFERSDILIIIGIASTVIIISSLIGAASFILYRHRYWNKPQTLSDKCSNADSSGYIDDSTLRENSEEMYSLDNDSFLNSLEAMTIQNYWTDNVKHTKL